MYQITPHTRAPFSPYFPATAADGVISFVPYNHMWLPSGYGDAEAEYWRLINGVSQWDVACERQVELRGADAARLAQILAPRDLSQVVVGQGKYVAICNHAGVLINDPVLLKLDDDRFWFSIADSDIFFWAQAIAAERKLQVDIRDPGVSPMALQGPKAADVVEHLFGQWARELKHFHFREARLEGIPMLVARSGWSKQGGYELYLQDESRAVQLWDIVREAGQKWDIGPGCPNACERIESGLLSWGGDTDDRTNPFEVRMTKYVDLNVPDEVIGIDTLRKINDQGPARHQLGVILDDETPAPGHSKWYDIEQDGRKIGDMTNGVWSRRLKKNIGFALVNSRHNSGEKVRIRKESAVSGQLVELPFI